MVEKGGRKANLESGLLASMCVVEVETVPLAWNRRDRRSSRRRSRSVLTVLAVIDGGRSQDHDHLEILANLSLRAKGQDTPDNPSGIQVQYIHLHEI
jgi:hypothetical protein